MGGDETNSIEMKITEFIVNAWVWKKCNCWHASFKNRRSNQLTFYYNTFPSFMSDQINKLANKGIFGLLCKHVGR